MQESVTLVKISVGNKGIEIDKKGMKDQANGMIINILGVLTLLKMQLVAELDSEEKPPEGPGEL